EGAVSAAGAGPRLLAPGRGGSRSLQDHGIGGAWELWLSPNYCLLDPGIVSLAQLEKITCPPLSQTPSSPPAAPLVWPWQLAASPSACGANAACPSLSTPNTSPSSFPTPVRILARSRWILPGPRNLTRLMLPRHLSPAVCGPRSRTPRERSFISPRQLWVLLLTKLPGLIRP